MKKIYFAMPAVGKLIILRHEPVPLEPFLVLCEDLFFAGKKVNTHVGILTCAARSAA